jgi:uncharacterized protein YbjT (DUF2867 family)
MSTPLILVTGATGTVGREVVKQLVAAGHRVRALVRDPGKAAKLGDGVEIVEGDLAKPATLDAAFSGVDRAFVLSPVAADLEMLEGNAFEAARRAGVKHVVKLSGVGVDGFMAGLPSGQWHAASEDRLRALGVAWTILRPGRFMSDTPFSWSSISERGILAEPTGEGRQALIDPRDIAAVGVKALTTPGHEGKIYELTGPEALNGAEIARKIASAIGKPVNFVDVTADAAREALLSAGLPEPIAELVVQYCARVRAGRCARVTPTVAELLGRGPRGFSAYLDELHSLSGLPHTLR